MDMILQKRDDLHHMNIVNFIYNKKY